MEKKKKTNKESTHAHTRKKNNNIQNSFKIKLELWQWYPPTFPIFLKNNFYSHDNNLPNIIEIQWVQADQFVQ